MIPRIRTLLLLLAFGQLFACQAQTESKQSNPPEPTFINSSGEVITRISKPESEWKEELEDQAYYVLRKQGTERAFTGEYWDNKEKGIYTCAACDLPLFESGTKYKSGTGWPSFYAPIDEMHVGRESDNTLGMSRTEVHCNRCGGHLGHVFNDGPQPTGLRYCINSVSLNFEPNQK